MILNFFPPTRMKQDGFSGEAVSQTYGKVYKQYEGGILEMMRGRNPFAVQKNRIKF
jgi:hypothetical protein